MRLAACLAIVDTRPSPAYVTMFDATPDIKWQLERLAPWFGTHPSRPRRIRQPDALFLTHAHMGHIGGLPQLGPEAMAVSDLPVYALPQLLDLLRANALWQPAVASFDLRPLTPQQPVALAPDVAVTPIPVPHRDEWGAGTVAFRVQGPRASLLYLPDIDAWDQWPQAKATLNSVDVALVDASFYSKDELLGRDPVAHPLVVDTLARFGHLGEKLVLTHFNHTNPVLDGDGEAVSAVGEAGVRLAELGMVFDL